MSGARVPSGKDSCTDFRRTAAAGGGKAPSGKLCLASRRGAKPGVLPRMLSGALDNRNALSERRSENLGIHSSGDAGERFV